jgi:hypothetical protein
LTAPLTWSDVRYHKSEVVMSAPRVAVVLLVLSAGGCACESRQLDLTARLECVGCTVEPDGKVLVDFGAVQVGTTAERELTLRNRGSTELPVVIPAVDALFSATPQQMTLPPGGTQTVTVSFAPIDEVESRVAGRIAGATGQALDLDLVGRGTRLRLSCAPHEATFGQVVVGTQRSIAVRCTNLDTALTADVTVSIEGQPEIQLVDGGLRHIPPGGSQDVNLRFAPTEAGERVARVAALDGSGAQLDGVNVHGRGIDSGLHVEPGPGPDGCYDLGFVAPGAGVTLPLRAVNDGNVPVHVTGLQVLPAGTPFQVEASPPLVLDAVSADGPSSEAALPVVFTPTELGTFAATVVLDSDDRVNGHLELCVRGIGGGPVLQCTPSVLAFGLTDIATPRMRTLFCTNVGTLVPDVPSALSVSGASTAAPFAAKLRDPPDRTYAPGESFAVDVAFSPTLEDVYAGELTVTSSGGTEKVALSGAGKAFPPCDLVLRPEEGLDYGVLNRDRALELPQILINHGTGECLVTDVEVTGDLARYFQVGPDWDAPRVLEPGEVVQLPVTFLGGLPGTYDASLRFVVNGRGSVDQPLHATVMDLCFEVAVDEADFGTVEPGCSSPHRYLQILNSCRDTVTITQIDVPAVTTDDFKILETPVLPYRVAGGAVAEVRVAYQPLAEGADVGLLRVFTDKFPGPVVGLLHGNGGPVQEQTDTFHGSGRSSADILWVIDNSGSMGDEAEAISKQARPFIDVALEKQIDFRMAVTTTDVTQSGLHGRLYPPDGNHPRILTSHMDRDALERDWAYMINQGSSGSGWEAGLEGAYLALSPPLIDSLDDVTTPEKYDGNAGFLRRDANLAIVVVTDDRDHSFFPENDFPDREPKDPDYWRKYLDFFRGIKGEHRSESMLRVHGINGGTEMPSCPTSYRPGWGYNDIIQATGGVIESICAKDWSETLRSIAEDAFTIQRCFTLSGQPGPAPGNGSTDPETWLRVAMGKKPYDKLSPGGNVRWNYYPETNEICFDPYYAPRGSDEVSVSYDVACGSPE